MLILVLVLMVTQFLKFPGNLMKMNKIKINSETSKFSINELIKVNLKEFGSFTGLVEGIAYNKEKFFYCINSGGIRLYTITEDVIEEI